MLYLVTEGQYSDTSIIALFSDESLAQHLADHLDQGKVIPMVLDAGANHLRAGYLPYLVWLNPDGTVDVCGPGMPDVEGHADDRLGDREFYVWANSTDEAICMAQQMYTPCLE